MFGTGAEPYLWAVLIAFWGVGDTVTTYLALTRYGGVERNPVPRRLFNEFGVWSMVPMKAVGLVIIYVSWRAIDDHSLLSLAALSLISLLGVAVTAWNSYQIATANPHSPRT